MNEAEARFRAGAKDDILHEFVANTHTYVLYRYGDFDELFITGSEYQWEFGLVWSKAHRCIVEKRFVVEDVRRAIESYIAKR